MYHNTGTNATAGGEFTDGDEGSGIPRSILGSAWLNMMQREGLNLLAAGGIAPNPAVFNQWTLAIQALIAPAVPQTGRLAFTLSDTAEPGWIIANDGTIGDAASGASTRANADCQALFTLLWTKYSNAICPVSGGRGANAAADWAAHKKIQTGFLAGRILGATGAGLFLTARSLGDIAGTETVLLTGRQSGIQNHNHYIGSRDSTADNSAAGSPNNAEFPRDWNYAPGDGYGPNVQASYSGDVNAEDAHPNMQPTFFSTLMIKL